ncbi:MAG: polyphenol oxidase family protein [Planctomycetota bacterium]|jgi:YfiH family protein|nr:polyphenol oxidase family protein [Planctomycetota bacterium]
MTPSAAFALPFHFPGLPNVRCLFSTRAAGDLSLDGDFGRKGDAVRNRLEFMRRFGLSRIAELRHVHGDGIVKAAETPPDAPAVGEADGLYTRETGLALVVKTADCQPILIARRDGRAVAALHVGWRGNAASFPTTAVERLCERFSCPPTDLLAVRGPSLGPTASEFVNFADEWPGDFAPWFDPASRSVDLWALTRNQLERAGLRRNRIFALDCCTHSMRDDFFSHRRNDTGRHWNVIRMV